MGTFNDLALDSLIKTNAAAPSLIVEAFPIPKNEILPLLIACTCSYSAIFLKSG